MYTPVPTLIPRIALNDHFIGSIQIKKDVYVDVGIIGNMSNEKHFANPDEFNPERFMNKID